ncbi:protein JOKA2 [Oryza brachyantha]|uniref:ZZ-type domain-containing protein n=1 Tax=Oryza brachyantha TaxID=4533 RepID=J3LYW5_ORYBR|nr:protein JOKA2 [Oryza brachyantha]
MDSSSSSLSPRPVRPRYLVAPPPGRGSSVQGGRSPPRGHSVGMPRRDAPPAEQPEAGWDLVVKVKFGGTLKRFNACVNGPHFDHNLAALRSKIASDFKFSPDTEFALTYTDEDGDIVMLEDDSDLCDAVISQKLNPLRINVELKSSSAGLPQTKQQVLDSISQLSTALEDQLGHAKTAIDEALKFVPEQVPIVLAKLSHDLRSKAASSAPSLADLLDRLAKLIAPKSNMQPSSGKSSSPKADNSSSSSSGREQTMGNSGLMAISASKPLDMQNSGSTKSLGLKGVLIDDIKTQAEPGYPSFVDSFSGWTKVDDIKAQAVPHVATIGHIAPTAHSACASNLPEGLRDDPFGPNSKITGDLNLPYLPPPPLLSRCPVQSPRACCCPSCAFKSGIPKPDNLSSVCPCGFYSEGTSSIRNPCRDLIDKDKSMAQHTLHRWIQCDVCGVTPIAGPRYKSNIKDDYDLCNVCFSRMGNVNEYTRIDKPSLESRRFRDINQNQMLLPHLQQRHDCRFIKDVTVPDGTEMAPSTPFMKIWRMHNNGSSMWPYGTCLIWVGGDQFARHSSVKLGISVDGFPIDQEIDVGVDFVTPTKPGRYISYWRLASPAGQMFGQRVWVIIQVEHPVPNSSNKQTAAVNLNLPPEGSNTEWKTIVDMNVEPTDLVGYYFGSAANHFARSLLHEATKRVESEHVSSAVPSVPTAFEPVQVPATDLPTSYAGAEKASIPTGVPAPEVIPLPTSSAGADNVSIPTGLPAPDVIPLPKPVSVPSSATEAASAPVSVTTAAPVPGDVAPISEPTAPAIAISMPSVSTGANTRLPTDTSPGAVITSLEDNMLRELEEMGFKKADLNKEILRRNEYNMEQSVDELCSILEWDVLHEELHELGIR